MDSEKMLRKFVKLVTITLFSLIPCTGYSFASGFYIGGQIGIANTNINGISSSNVIPDIYTVTEASDGKSINYFSASATLNTLTINSINLGQYNSDVNDKVTAGLLYFGYQFSEFVAMELGGFTLKDSTATYRSNTTVNADATASFSVLGVTYPASLTGSFTSVGRKDTISDYGFNLLVKVILPLSLYSELYTKLGGAYLIESTKTVININSSPSSVTLNVPDFSISAPLGSSLSISESNTTNNNRFYPVLGVGGSYAITDNIKIDIAWYRIIRDNSTGNNIDIVAGGLIYALS